MASSPSALATRPAASKPRYAAAACIALALVNCDGAETTRPKWISLPVSLGDNSNVQLIGVDSNLCLEIGGSGYSDRDPLQLAGCAVASRQQFRLVHKTGGQFQITSASSGRCLDVDSASTAPMARVFLWQCGDGANQQFSIANRGSLTQLQVRHSGLCLDVQGAGRAPGTPIIQWPCSGAPNQRFWLVPATQATTRG